MGLPFSRISQAVTSSCQVLVSQDSGWYHVGEPGGGEYRPHTTLMDSFVPALKERGLGEEQIRTLLVDNPGRAFALGVRPLGTSRSLA